MSFEISDLCESKTFAMEVTEIFTEKCSMLPSQLLEALRGSGMDLYKCIVTALITFLETQDILKKRAGSDITQEVVIACKVVVGTEKEVVAKFFKHHCDMHDHRIRQLRFSPQ